MNASSLSASTRGIEVVWCSCEHVDAVYLSYSGCCFIVVVMDWIISLLIKGCRAVPYLLTPLVILDGRNIIMLFPVLSEVYMSYCM
jgi:hypothetical protein